jgi:hypothetical protein
MAQAEETTRALPVFPLRIHLPDGIESLASRVRNRSNPLFCERKTKSTGHNAHQKKTHPTQNKERNAFRITRDGIAGRQQRETSSMFLKNKSPARPLSECLRFRETDRERNHFSGTHEKPKTLSHLDEGSPCFLPLPFHSPWPEQQ